MNASHRAALRAGLRPTTGSAPPARPPSRRGAWLAVACGLAALGATWGQQVRTSIIKGFEFSEFDPQTNERQYTLTGDAEFGRDASLVKLTSVRVVLFDTGGTTNMVMRTPLAMFDQETKRAESEEPVLIESEQMRISGVGMLWEPTARRLVLDRDVRIEMFDTAGLLPAPPGSAPAPGDAAQGSAPAPAGPGGPATGSTPAPQKPPTVVEAARLTYDMNAREVNLGGGITAIDGDTRLTAGAARLELAKEGQSARQIEATGAVTIVRGGLVARGGRAEYDVTSRRITLLEQPVVSRGADRLESARLDWDAEAGLMRATGSPRLVLARAAERGLSAPRPRSTGRRRPAAEPPTASTEIYADDLQFDLAANRAQFTGDVLVLSPAVNIGASRMEVELTGGLGHPSGEAPPEGSDQPASEEGGDIARIAAEGLVEIVQQDLRALCDRATYDPKTGEAQLTGNPRVFRGSDRLTGDLIWLNLRDERLRCGPAARVLIADAGKVEGRVLGGGGPAPERRQVEITSREVEFWLAENRGVFRDEVRVESHDLTIRADRLDALLEYAQDERVLRQVVAQGAVEIVQGDRRARSGKALYDAFKGEVVLTESPELAGDRVLVTADQITFYVDKDQLYCDPHPRLRAYPEELPEWAREAAGRPGGGRLAPAGETGAAASGVVPPPPGRSDDGTAGTFRRGEVPPVRR